jgi:Rrf2 family cysteine metabolism transcriptional repressor
VKLSTRGRYGIHAMYDLACYHQSEPQSIKAIAERQHIPEAYLEQLIAVLRRNGLVSSVRGAQGGYLLARRPGEITVGEVLRVLEGDLALVDCLVEEDVCNKACSCPTRLVWQKLRNGINEILDGITLQDMLNDYERMAAQGEDIE